MKKQLACMLLTAAVCLSGCNTLQQVPTTGEPEPSSQTEGTQPTGQTTLPATTAPSEPVTVPPTTAAPTEPTQAPTQAPTEAPTQAPTQAPTEPSAAPTETAPAIQSIQPQAVISETVTEIAKLIPELKYDPARQTGTVVPISVGKTLSHEDAVAELHDSMLELFDYDLYLEQQENPGQVQPVIFDYTYSIRYAGMNEDNTAHIFQICYVINRQSYVSDTFDSDEVIRLVTQAVTESTRIKVTAFEDDNYTRVVVYDNLPYFYTTGQSVERLADSIENEIYGENLGIVKYTQFRLVFHSKGEINYTFLLYLR